jgi:hypothetical protein
MIRWTSCPTNESHVGTIPCAFGFPAISTLCCGTFHPLRFTTPSSTSLPLHTLSSPYTGYGNPSSVRKPAESPEMERAKVVGVDRRTQVESVRILDERTKALWVGRTERKLKEGGMINGERGKIRYVGFPYFLASSLTHLGSSSSLQRYATSGLSA